MAAKSRMWDFLIFYSFCFFEGMYFFSVATFSKEMNIGGVVEHFRWIIDRSLKANFEL